MSRLAALSLSMALLLLAFPLISAGTTGGGDALWQAGLASLVIGGLIPPVGLFLRTRRAEPPPTRAGLSEDCRVS